MINPELKRCGTSVINQEMWSPNNRVADVAIFAQIDFGDFGSPYYLPPRLIKKDI